jgi:tryptophan synthase beta chain
MEAFRLLCRTEGIIPAIETAHALAGTMRLGRVLGPDAVLLVCLSGRGDKDVDTAARWFEVLSDAEIVEAAEAVTEVPVAEGSGEGW